MTVSSEAAPPLPRARKSRGLTAAFAGYDAFVSYARSDAAGYARALQAGLETAGLVVFVDYQAIPPGEALRSTLRRGIRRSGMLVAICSPAAVRSQWVGLEVAEAAKRNRKIVLINVDNAYGGADWHLDPDLVWVAETGDSLLRAQPSKGIVEEVLNRVEHTRRQNVVVRVFAAAMLVLAALLVAVAWNWRQAVMQREMALAQKLVALSETETQRGPQHTARVALLLIESLRRRETPEAVGALASSTRLLRPILAAAKIGKNVRFARFSPDGASIAAAGLSDSDRAFIGIWNATDLQKRWIREVDAKSATAFDAGVTWTPDGREIVWRGSEHAVEILSAGTASVVESVTIPGAVSAIAMSPDGRWIAIGDLGGTVTVWDRLNRAVTATLKAGRNVLGLAFAPDGSALAFGGGLEGRPGSTGFEDFSLLGIATPVNWSAPVRVVRVPGPVMEGIAISPNGRYLAIPGGVARLYDVRTLQDLGSFGQGQFVGSVAFSRSGRFLATTSTDRTARVFDLQKGGVRARFVHDAGVRYAAFSDDERTVATAGEDNTARIWHVAGQNPTEFSEGGQPEQARLPHDGSVWQVQFDATGRRLLTNASDGYLRVWSTPDTTFRLVTDEALLGLAISPDGHWLVTAGSDYRPGLWDLSADAEPRRLAVHENDLTHAVFSANGRWLATADDDSLTQVFRTDSFERIARLSGRRIAFGRDQVVTDSGSGPVRRYAVPKGDVIEEIPVSGRVSAITVCADTVLALATNDGAIVLRDIGSSRSGERARMQHGRSAGSLACAPRGDLLASGGDDGIVRLWRPSGELRRSFNLGEGVSAVAFDRTGEFVAAGGSSGTVIVWSLRTGTAVARFSGSQRVNTLAFTAAGADILFAGGYDGFRSTLWRAADLTREACARLPRLLLSPDEWQTFVQSGQPVSACSAASRGGS